MSFDNMVNQIHGRKRRANKETIVLEQRRPRRNRPARKGCLSSHPEPRSFTIRLRIRQVSLYEPVTLTCAPSSPISLFVY